MRNVAAVALLASFALFACGNGMEKPTTESSAQPSVTAQSAQADEKRDDEDMPANKRLALAKLSGDNGVDKALRLAQETATKNPTKEDSWILLGRAWVQKARQSSDPGFYLNANACADVALEITKDSKVALDLKGLVLLNDHKFEDARALSAAVVSKHPDDPMAHGNLSDALLELGQYDAAAKAAQEMVDLKPNLPSYSRASYIQWLRGDAKAAKESVRLAIDAGNDGRDREPRAWVLVQAAMIFWHAGDYDGAEAGFDQALAWNPEFPPALVGKGRVLVSKGDGKGAASYLARAYQASPLVETAWLLGDARAMSGDKAGADAAYALVEKEGKKSDPRTLSAFYSTKNENPELALRLAEEEWKIRKDIYTDDALAWALYRNGRWLEAREAITRARRLGTNDARILYHEGAIRMATGDRPGGTALIRRAVAMNPRFDAALAVEAQSLVALK